MPAKTSAIMVKRYARRSAQRGVAKAPRGGAAARVDVTLTFVSTAAMTVSLDAQAAQ